MTGQARLPASRNNQLSSIESLPPVVFNCILDKLDCRVDAVCLSLTSKAMATSIAPFLDKDQSPCPADFESYMTLMSRLETWMPENSLFCYHCLMYRPRINFDTFAMPGPNRIVPPAEMIHTNGDKEIGMKMDNQVRPNGDDFFSSGGIPLLCYDCDRAMSAPGYKGPYMGCNCGECTAPTCVGCEVLDTVGGIVAEQSDEDEFEAPGGTENGDGRPYNLWSSDECCT